MPRANTVDLASALSLVSYPIKDSPEDYDYLLDRIGDARLVLIGEPSHGTHEFYRERAYITRRLLEEKGFEAVAVEADWPDAYQVNRFVKSDGDVLEGTDPLAGFKRFPQWMWRNTEVLDFTLWLRQFNDTLPRGRRKAGFYGLDLYSLQASIEAVLAYLDEADPEAALRARERYACFEGPAERYGYQAALGLTPTCEQMAMQQLLDLRRKSEAQVRGLGDARATEAAEQGELNLGQLLRERHGSGVFSLGMSTYTGTVMAASDWGTMAEAKRVRPALPDSYEELFHETGLERFLIDLRDDNEVVRELGEARLQRAIGVIYRPEAERASHYYHARLPDQFDALLHFDHTRALDPIGPPDPRLEGGVPETFPSAV